MMTKQKSTLKWKVALTILLSALIVACVFVAEAGLKTNSFDNKAYAKDVGTGIVTEGADKIASIESVGANADDWSVSGQSASLTQSEGSGSSGSVTKTSGLKINFREKTSSVINLEFQIELNTKQDGLVGSSSAQSSASVGVAYNKESASVLLSKQANDAISETAQSGVVVSISGSTATVTLAVPSGTEYVYLSCSVTGSNHKGLFTTYKAGATLTVSNLRYFIQKFAVTVNVSNSNYGAVEGVELQEGVAQVPMGTTLTLVAKPNERGQFFYWANEKGELLTESSSYTFTVTQSVTLNCVIDEIGHFVARAGNTFYTSFDSAFEANSSVTLMSNEKGLNQDIVVPAGKTLVLPYNAEGDYFGKNTNDPSNNPTGSSTNFAWSNPSLYRYMHTVVNGNVTVHGTLRVGGVMYYPSTGLQGHTSGPYSELTLNGNLTIESGGSMEVFGLVNGNGGITVNNGGVLKQPYVVLDFTGGSNTQSLYNAGQSPFYRYAMVNIQTKQGYTINYGGKLVAHVQLYTGTLKRYNETDVNLIGYGSNAMFLLEEGAYVKSVYDSNSGTVTTSEANNTNHIGKTKVVFNGGAQMSAMSLEITIIINMTVSTENVYFPLPYNYDLELKNGNYTIQKKVILMPGSQITVDSDATLNVNKDGGLQVLDGMTQSALAGKQYPTAAQLKTYGYKTNGTLIVNGTLNIGVGGGATFLGTVQSTEAGGKICIAEGSTVQGDVVCGLEGSNQVTYKQTARVWDKVHGVIANLEAGKNYTSVISEKWVMTCADSSLPQVEGMQGAWKEDHEGHNIDWSPLETDPKPTASNRVTTLTHQCGVLGCEHTDSKRLLYTPASIDSIVYKGAEYTSDEIKTLIDKYFGTTAQPLNVTVDLGGSTVLKAATYNLNVTLPADCVWWSGGEYQSDAKTVSLTVVPFALTDSNVEQVASQQYSGSRLTPQVTVRFNGDELTLGSDFNVTWSGELTDVATYTGTVKGTGNFDGEVSVTFAVTPKEVTQAAVEAQELTYTGKEQTPAVSVDGFAEQDYDVVFDEDADRTNAGTVQFSVKFKGNYTGTLSCSFVINKASANSVEVNLEQTSFEYNGQTVTPTVTVKLGEVVLSEEDYAVNTGNYVDVTDEATVTVTLSDKNFDGNLEQTAHFSITAKPVTLSEVRTQHVTYNGKAQNPASVAEVDFKQSGLVESDNVAVTLSVNGGRGATNAGSYNVTATLVGNKASNYKLAQTQFAGAFVVDKAALETLLLDHETHEYTGSRTEIDSAHVKSLTAQGGLNVAAEYYTLSVSADNWNAGTVVTVTATATEQSNFSGSANATFTITAKDASHSKVTVAEGVYVYNKQPHTPEVTVELDGFEFVVGKDFDVDYHDNVNAGTVTVTVNFKGNFCGSASDAENGSFEIVAKTITVTLDKQTVIYNGSAQSARANDGYRIEGLENGDEITLTLSSASLTNIGKTALKAELVGDETTLDNYTVSGSLELAEGFEVLPADISDKATVTVSGTYVYNNEQHRPESENISVTVTGVRGAVTFEIDCYGGNVTVKDGGTVTVKGTGNFTGKATGTFSIERAAVTIKAANKSSHAGEQQEELTTYVSDGKLFDDGNRVLQCVTLSVDGDVSSAQSGARFTIKAQYVDDGTEANGNYAVSVQNGTYTVTDAVFKDMIFDNDSVVYDGAQHGLTVSNAPDGAESVYTYFKGEQQLEQMPVDAGAYKVVAKVTLQQENHTYTTEQEAELTITRKSATIVLQKQTAVYTGGDLNVEQGKWSWGDDVLSQDKEYLTVTLAGTGKKVGAYTVTAIVGGDKAANYNFGTSTTLQRGFSVTVKDVTLVIHNQEAVYSGKPLNVTTSPELFELTGIAEGDEVTVTLKGSRTNVGTADITADVSGEDAYNYNVQVTDGIFTVQPKPADGATVSVSGSFVYNGKAKEPVPTVTLDDAVLERDNFELSYSDNTDAGNATVTVRFKGNYSGEALQNFTISPKSATITVNKYTLTYNGAEQSASGASVTFGNVETTDLGGVTATVTGSGKDVGTYPVSVSYGGDRARNYTFRILGASTAFVIEAASVTSVEVQGKLTYNGSEQTPAVVVKAGELTVGDDSYSISFDENVNRTDAADGIAFKVVASGNFKGELSGTFDILPCQVVSPTLRQNGTATYNGQEQKPEFTVTFGGKSLVADKDYTLLYGNNINAGSDALVTVTFRGNYSGVATKNFTINKKAATLTLKAQTAVYNGETQSASSLDSYYEWSGLVEGDVDGLTVTLAGSRKDVGSVRITASITGEKANNYTFTTSQNVNFSITKASVAVTVKNQTVTYTGMLQTAQTGSEFWTVDGTVFANDDLFLKVEGRGTAAGEYDLTLTSGNGNYNVSYNEGEAKLVILPKEIVVTLQDKTSVYGNALEPFTFSAEGVTDADKATLQVRDYLTITSDVTTKPTFGRHTITATATNPKNYTIRVVDGTYSITARPVTVTLPSYTRDYNKQPARVNDLGNAVAVNLANGDAVDDLNLTLSIAGEHVNVGDYAVTAVWNNENYNVSFVEGNYKITKYDVSDEAFFFISVGDFYDAQENVLHAVFTGEPLTVSGYAIFYGFEDTDTIDVQPSILQITSGGSFSVVLDVVDDNYQGSQSFTVEVEDKSTVHLDEVLARLHELADDLTTDELTLDHFDVMRQVYQLLNSLSDEERAQAGDELEHFDELVSCWNSAANDNDVVKTAQIVADAPINWLFATAASLSALLAACYVVAKGGLL